MGTIAAFDYKKETNRYKYYYQRLQIFYQKPAVVVSSAVLFTLATIIFFAVFAIRPTLQTISELLKKIDDQKKVLTLAEKKASSLASAQQQLDMIAPHIPALTLAIPENYATQNLLKDIEATAGKLNIPLSGLKISELEYPVPDKNSGKIQEFTFTISMEAQYPVIKQFTDEMLKLPRVIAIDSITISKSENNQNSLTPNALTGSIKCRVFYLADEKE